MYNQYRYKIELRYPMTDKGEIIIDSTNIHSVGISYDYDNRNMPILLMKVAIDKNVIDDMIKNNKTKYMRLIISKYISNSKSLILENYVNDQFVYFLDNNDLNSQKDLDYSVKTKDSEDIYKIITIGLIKQELINNNKKIINGIFNGQNLMNIMMSYMTHMKILVEPMKDNNSLGNVIIPTVDTVTKFVKYMDDTYNMYDTPYRLFYDYDKTYLLSHSGNVVPSIEEKYSTIIINVNNELDENSKVQGVYIDASNRSYRIDVAAGDINLFEDTASIKSFNNIIGIDSSGNTKQVFLDLEGANNKISKTKIQKINNLERLDNMKAKIETNSIAVNVVKTDIDTSIFTINKEYYIRNYNKLEGKNGKFILASKREVYSRDKDDFAITVILVFKKIKS